MGDPADPPVATGQTTADASDPELGASPLIPELPDDLSVQCLARVPRSSHPALVLVSRSWRSLLRSRRLFSLRAQLRATEPSLCVNICNGYGESRWYFLSLHPCRLLPLPPNPFPSFGSGCAVLGSSLYVLGCYNPSSTVQIFDPCLNLWTAGPPMGEPRQFPAASVLRGRVYVFDGNVSLCNPDGFDPQSGSRTEVLDPAAGAWASLPRLPTHLWMKFVCRSHVLGGQIFLGGGLVLDPDAAQPWRIMSEVLRSKWAGQAAVVLDGVLYTHDSMGELGGYDLVADVWKPVVGLEGVPADMHTAELTNLGGMLCFVWAQIIENGRQEMRPSMREKPVIHFVGVEIIRTSCGGFRGSIAWQEVVAMPISDGMLMHAVVLEF